MATKEQLENEIEVMKEKFELLKGKVELLEILAKNPSQAVKKEAARDVKKIIQINIKPKTETKIIRDKTGVYKDTMLVKEGEKYFCETPDEVRIFEMNHPGVETESFKVELETAVADRYINNPENAKAFEVKKETIDV